MNLDFIYLSLLIRRKISISTFNAIKWLKALSAILRLLELLLRLLELLLRQLLSRGTHRVVQKLNVVCGRLLLRLTRLNVHLTRSHLFATKVVVDYHPLPGHVVVNRLALVAAISQQERDEVCVVWYFAWLVISLRRYRLFGEQKLPW